MCPNIHTPALENDADISVSSQITPLRCKIMLVIMHVKRFTARWPRQIVQWQMLVKAACDDTNFKALQGGPA